MKHFEKCQVKRRLERKTFRLDPLVSSTPIEQVSTVVELCGAPLFGEDTVTGVCPTCLKGFETSNNHITENGWKLVRRAIGDAQWTAFVQGEPQLPLPTQDSGATHVSISSIGRHLLNLVRDVRVGHLFHRLSRHGRTSSVNVPPASAGSP